MGEVIKKGRTFFNDLGKCFNYTNIHAKAPHTFLTTFFFHNVDHRQCRHLLPDGVL